MLSEDDLKFMKESQKEIRENRESLIVIEVRESVGKHPITGEDIYDDLELAADAVITKISSTSFTTRAGRWLSEGVEISSGDVIFDIFIEDDFELTEDNVNKVIYEYDYKVVAIVKLGISYPSRYEIVGRRIY